MEPHDNQRKRIRTESYFMAGAGHGNSSTLNTSLNSSGNSSFWANNSFSERSGSQAQGGGLKGQYVRPSILNREYERQPYSKTIKIRPKREKNNEAFAPHMTSTALKIVETLAKNASPVLNEKKIPLHEQSSTVKQFMMANPYAKKSQPTSSSSQGPPKTLSTSFPSSPSIFDSSSFSSPLMSSTFALGSSTPYINEIEGHELRGMVQERGYGGGKIGGRIRSRIHPLAPKLPTGFNPNPIGDLSQINKTLQAPNSANTTPEDGITFSEPLPLGDLLKLFQTYNEGVQRKRKAEEEISQLESTSSLNPEPPKHKNLSPEPSEKSVNEPKLSNFSFGAPKKPEGNWECPTCMVNNTENALKCIACEEPNPKAPKSNSPIKSTPFSSSFGATGSSGSSNTVPSTPFKFGISSSTSIVKDSPQRKSLGGAGDAPSSPAESIKPKASEPTPTPPKLLQHPNTPSSIPQSKDKETPAQSNPSPVKPSTMEPLKSFGFGMPPKPSGGWECPTCMVSNTASDLKCLACEEPNPKAPKSTPTPSTSTTSTSSSIVFGVSSTAPSTPSSIVFGASSTAPSTPFKFGVTPTASTPLNKGSEPSPNKPFSNPPSTFNSLSSPSSIAKEPVNASSLPAKSIPSSEPSTNKETTAPAASNFSFGAPLKPAVVPGWECPTCMVKNIETALKCIACEGPNPKAPKESIGNNSTGFGTTGTSNAFSTPSTPFQFGINKPTLTANSAPSVPIPQQVPSIFGSVTLPSDLPKPSPNNFTFGAPAAAPPKPAVFSNPNPPIQFNSINSFSLPTQPPAQNNNHHKEEPPSFTTGQKRPSSSSSGEPASKSFSFGGNGNSTGFGGPTPTPFQFGGPSTTPAVPIPQQVPTIFGASGSLGEQPKPFSFGAPKAEAQAPSMMFQNPNPPQFNSFSMPSQPQPNNIAPPAFSLTPNFNFGAPQPQPVPGQDGGQPGLFTFSSQPTDGNAAGGANTAGRKMRVARRRIK